MYLPVILMIISASGYCGSGELCNCSESLHPLRKVCPECCCDVPNNNDARSCCVRTISRGNTANKDNESYVDQSFMYFVAAFFVLFLMALCIICGFRMTSNIKCTDLLRWETRDTRENSITFTSSTDNVSEIEEPESARVEIVMVKCPPYVKNPPSYLEAMTTDLPDILVSSNN